MKKKIISLLLSVVMCITMTPTYVVFAGDADNCDHILTAENISELPSDFWDDNDPSTRTHNGETYDVGTDAIISIAEPETCTKDGWKRNRSDNAGYCMLCHKIIGEPVVVEAKGHNFTDSVSDATCTKGSVSECSNTYYEIEWNQYYNAKLVSVECKETEQADDALGHSYDEGTVTKEPTCIGEGIKTFTCTRGCGESGDTYTEPIPATGHNLVDVAEKAPTCTQKGNTAGQKCTKCNYTTVKDVPALGHDYQVVDSQEATCLVGGFKKEVCSRCGDEKVTKTDPLGHLTDDSKWETQQEPTCEKDGYATQDCMREGCNKTAIKVLPATDHAYKATETVDPGCETSGYILYVCQNDTGHSYKEIIDPLGHDWSEELTVIEPTCTKDGEQYYACSRCDKKNEYKKLNALGHNFDANGDGIVDEEDGVITKEPACTEKGVRTYTCTRDCGEEGYTYTEEIPALGHHVVLSPESKFPTCIKDGYNLWECDRDGCDHAVMEPLDALGHLIPDEYDEVANCVHGNQYVCQRELPDGSICDTFVDDGKRNYNLTFTQDSDIESADSIDIPEDEIPDGAKLFVSKTGNFEVDYSKDESGQLLTGHNYNVTYIPARCEFDAYYLYECTNEGCPDSEDCENHVFIVAVANTATGHRWALRDDNTNTDPSCTQDGTRHYVCLNDHDHVYTEKLPATGHNFVLIDTIDATCQEGGYNLYECQNVTNDNDKDSVAGTKCGEIYKEYITSPIPHNYVVTEKVAATCTEEGYEVYTCDMCNTASYKKTTTPAKGHDYKVTSSVAATCTEEGYDVYTCANCGEEYKKTTTSAKGHNYVVTSSVPATCTEEGYDVYACSECGDSFKKTTTHALGHTFVASDFKDAACTEAGYTTYTCINSGCQETYKADFISAKGHSYRADVVAPTCSKPGYTYYTCEVCGETRKDASGNLYKTNETKPVNHVLNTVSTVAPTCGKDGKKISKCENCDYVQEEVIPATGNHTYSDVVQTPATCGKDGVMKHVCDVCGDEYTTVIPALEHNYTYEETPATCTENGKMVATCTNCGDVQEYVEPARGHIYDTNGVYTPATCTKDGYTTYTCVICGKQQVTELDDKAMGHTIVSAVTKPAEVNKDGTITNSCLHCNEATTTIIIPSVKSVTLSKTKYIYSGYENKPKVTVKDRKGSTISSKYYTVKYSSNKSIGTAKVTVTFKGNYKGTVTKSFTIIPKNVGISEISTSKGQIKFRWGIVGICDGYQIQYSTSSSYKNAKTIKVKGRKTNNYTIKKLKKGKKYYIRVRTYKAVKGKTYYGNWSTVSKTCK